MEELIRKVVPSEINSMNIGIEGFIALYSEGKCELVDGLTGLTEYLKGGKAKTIKL